MPNVEVDQGRLGALEGAERLFNDLLQNPDFGLKLKRQIKEQFPTAKLPDLDFADQVSQPITREMAAIKAQNDALQKKIDELSQARETDIAEGKLTKQLDKVRDEYGFTDTKMAEVVETMKTRNLAHDPDAAAALVAKTLPHVAPAGNGSWTLPSKMDVFGLNTAKVDAAWENLHAKPWEFFDNAVVEVMNDPIWGTAA